MQLTPLHGQLAELSIKAYRLFVEAVDVGDAGYGHAFPVFYYNVVVFFDDVFLHDIPPCPQTDVLEPVYTRYNS